MVPNQKARLELELKPQTDAKKSHRPEYFTIKLEFSGCLEDQDDSSIRKFRKKVIEKF